MRILVTAWRLIDFTGADLYTRDLAIALSRRGHEVVVHTPFPGQIADRIRSVAVPVVSDLRTLKFDPQIIHGQHRPALLAALKRYPGTPAISLMHGATAAIDAPVPLSRIRRYVAVDDVCRARLTREPGIPPERTRVILNFADLNRFAPRSPLPASPRRALVFSNYADRSTHLPALTEACRRAGLPLDVAGGGVGRTVEEPGPLLAGYDLVFAKARCAIEAMAVGTAVVLCDFPGLGPRVTSANFSRLRRMNFGASVLTAPLNPEAIGDAIRGYDAADAAAVSARTREEADMEKAIDAWVGLYQEVLEEAGHAVADSPAEAARLDAAIRHSRTFFRREAVTGRLRRVQSLPLVGGGLYAQLHRLRRALTKPAKELEVVTTPRWKRMVQAVLPRPLERRLRDRLEDSRRRRPSAHGGLEQFGLPGAQVYPAGTNFDACLQAGLQSQFADLAIRRSTPVASIGSCFADEFASYMRRGRFAYVTAESDVFPASANWGRVYTIPAFRQIVDYSIEESFPTALEEGPDGWFDPLRDPIVGRFATWSEAESALRAHRRASRHAFCQARVLIVTLGQNEAWIDEESGLVWARVPPAPILTAPGRKFTAREFSFEDNVEWLEASLTSLRTLNPDLDVLLTVSPVASYATFCGVEAVTQSFAGKAVLRAVAERITRRMRRVWYFPAFEMTLAYNPHTLNADNRHVKNSTVDRILALFRTTVVRSDE